jgi:predicted O-methyltransferase YrrM
MNSLMDPAVAASLAQLHDEAARDATRPRDGDAQSLTRRGNIYMAVSPEEGRLLYLLARGSGAQRIVEFGASFGVSTTYLAAAARDNGGRLITTEAHPGKCAATRATLAEAGLADIATVLEGDARETLADTEPGIDFLFLDGWKSMYLPMLELLEPKLADGALIVADNIDHEGARPYADHVRMNDAFVSHSLRKMEISCFAPD